MEDEAGIENVLVVPLGPLEVEAVVVYALSFATVAAAA